MTKDEFVNSNIYAGKLVFIDGKTNALWSQELLSSNSKKAKALLARFPKGGTFKKLFVVKFIIKNGNDEFDLGLEEE